MNTENPPEPLPGADQLFSLDPTVSYLNHAMVGAVPIGVRHVHKRLLDEAEVNPTRFYLRDVFGRVTQARRSLATFLGADPDGSALVSNATTATSIVLNSVLLEPGDEILLTNHEFPGVELAARHRAQQAGAAVRAVAVPLTAADAEVVALVRAALRPGKTKLLIVDQLTASTATIFPVRAITAAAHEYDIPVLVDGAHIPGMVPVDVNAIGADFWFGNLHKWAFAPRGTALLTVAPAWRERIKPLAAWFFSDQGFPLSVEHHGTLDYSPWLAAPTGLSTLRSLGWEEVRAYNAALATYGQRVVGAALGLSASELPEPGAPDVSMRVVPLPPGLATTQADAHALQHHIADKLATEVAVNAWDGQALLRLSAQVYNKAYEYEKLADRLPQLLTNYQH